MAKAIIQPSFAAGEISPKLYGRVDLAKFHVGAALMRNFFVDYKGGAPSRPGTRYLGIAKQAYGTPPRLMSFVFSQQQAYTLEFGDHYIRFIQNSGYILETAINITGITKANPGVVTAAAHGLSNGDTVEIVGVGGMTQLNGKTFTVANAATNTFTLVDIWGVAVNTTNFTTYTSGGTVARYYTITSPYAAIDLPLLKRTQSADTMTLTHPNYPVYQLKRLAQTNWTLTAPTFAAAIQPPSSVTAAVQQQANVTNGVAMYSYVITAVSDSGEESIASSPAAIQNGVISTTQGSNIITWSNVTGAAYYKVYNSNPAYAASSPAPAVPVGSLYGLIATYITGLQYVDDNNTPDFAQTPPAHEDPFAPGAIQYVTPVTNGTGYSQGTVGYTITTSTGTGAVLQPIVVNGGVAGAYVINGGSNYAPGDTIAFTGGSSAAATLVIGPASGVYPGVVTYFQQRQYFANTLNQPISFWASKPGLYLNFDSSDLSQDSDALSETLAAQQVNGIQAMVAMPSGLVLLTGMGAWQLTGGNVNTAVTPSDATATPQAYNGCSSNVPPVTVNYDILYVQAKGSIVRDLAYNFFVNIYTGTDLTVLSSHLFTGYQILEWAWAEEPYKLMWCVRNDGQLLSLTYLKEQDVYAWAHHDTFGLYQSVCVIPEFTYQTNGTLLGADICYVVVARVINNVWKYYVERFDARVWNTVEDTWAVDAGVQTTPTYPNATLTVSAASGNVTLTASSGVFSAGMVGQVVRVGGGIITLTGYTNATTMTGTVTQSLTNTLPNNGNNAPIPVPAGFNAWSIWTPITALSGLDHLNGATVSILADGSVLPSQVVSNGSISLGSQPVTKVVAGLGFQAQLQSLYVDSSGGPTVQGKRKNIPALTVRMENSRGLKVGRTFATVVEFKERGNSVYAGLPIPLYTGDHRMPLDGLWDVPGQVCAQQDYPLPADILAFIPEINVGDDFDV